MFDSVASIIISDILQCSLFVLSNDLLFKKILYICLAGRFWELVIGKLCMLSVVGVRKKLSYSRVEWL